VEIKTLVTAQNERFVSVLAPISVAGGATATCIEIDTLNLGVPFDYLRVIVYSGLIPSTGFATLKLQESEVSGSGGVDITGAAWTALVNADDGIMVGCNLNLLSRKRYITLVATNGATNASLIAAFGILSRGAQAPSTATLRGLQEELTV